MRKGKKIFLSILGVFLLLSVAGLWISAVAVYRQNFCVRCETYEPHKYLVEDFEGLSRTRYEFKSNKGQTLVGYMYYSDFAPEDKKAIVVMAHGFGGGGHNGYMDLANYFAKNGFYVFAYDATGNDESEGKYVGSLVQGVVDLDYAISFLEGNDAFPKIPIVLWGHSWGAYSVSNVINFHPEVKAVIECAGWNKPSEIFRAQGQEIAGNAIWFFMPFIKIHEFVNYGKYATATALKGLKKSDASFMAVHSSDDDTVPEEIGYSIYYDKYRDDPRFTFLHFTDRGHNHLFSSGDYNREINAEFAAWCETLDYDYHSQEEKDRFEGDKLKWTKEHLDRKKWADRLDEEIVSQFVDFYNESLER